MYRILPNVTIGHFDEPVRMSVATGKAKKKKPIPFGAKLCMSEAKYPKEASDFYGRLAEQSFGRCPDVVQTAQFVSSTPSAKEPQTEELERVFKTMRAAILAKKSQPHTTS